MPKIPQIFAQKQSSLPVPSPHSYTVMQFSSTQNDDDGDDDICPVCESECTCGNNNNNISTSAPPSSSAPTSIPLKIKLPARHSFNPVSTPSAVKRARPKSIKPKQTTVGSAIVDGNVNNYVLLHRPGPFSAPGHQLGAPVPFASTSTTISLFDTSSLTPEPELQFAAKVQPKPKPSTKAIAPKSSKNARTKKPSLSPTSTRKKLTTRVRNRINKDATWTTSSARRKSKLPVQSSSDEFETILTDEDTYVTGMTVDSDGTQSVQFPTFISAISTTSDNDDSTSTISDSFDSDDSIRAEEEGLILAEQRAKVRREILNGEESWHMEKRKWDHLKNNNNWEIRPRKRSVGPDEADGGTESDSEAGEEEEEEEEGDDDDDEDADVRDGRGMVTGWLSDDDDFDAELFFATLTDSSGPGSDADVEDGEDSGDDQSDNSDLSSISITEAAAAGLLSSPFGAGCPLVVTEDWDGRLVFANGLKDGQGVLDVHFEVSAAQRHRSIREAMEIDPEETEENAEEDDNDDEEFISDDGETTDDMLDHRLGISTPRGIVPLPFRCPTPPVASIDPLSTFSPIVGSRHRKLIYGTLPVESPKPADILAGAGKFFWESNAGIDTESSLVRSPSASITVASPGTATSSSQSRQMPSMGSFKQVSTDPKRRAIIDGSKAIVFSPFTRIGRVGRHSGRGRKRTAAGNDLFPYTSKRPRQSSLPGSSRSLLLVDPEDEGGPLVHSSPELPLSTASIDLNDVLDASFLDSDCGESAANMSGERHLRNLNRWDRIPMGTFRRSRTAHMDENAVRVSALVPPNDGVSYGSAGGRVLRKSPLGAALWQTNTGTTKPRYPPGSVAVSPVIFPVRDGERTPTAGQYSDPLQKPLSIDTSPSKSRKQKRKEKKKLNNPLHPSSTPSPAPTSHELPNPSLNVPLLNL